MRPTQHDRAFMESLDARLVLSAAPLAVIVPPGAPPTADQVLVTLVRGQEKMMADEIALLNAAGAAVGSGGGSIATYNKLAESLQRLTDATYDLGGAVVATAAKVSIPEITVSKRLDKGSTKLMDAQRSVNSLAASLGILNSENSALGSLNFDTNSLADNLVTNPPLPGSVSQDELVRFTQVSNAFDSFDSAVLHVVSEDKKGTGKSGDKETYLQVRLTDVLVSSLSRVPDGDVRNALAAAANDTYNLVFGSP